MAAGSRRPRRFLKIAISASCAASGPSCSAIGPHTLPTYGASTSTGLPRRSGRRCAARTRAGSITGGAVINAIVARRLCSLEQLAGRLGHLRGPLGRQEVPGPGNDPQLQAADVGPPAPASILGDSIQSPAPARITVGTVSCRLRCRSKMIAAMSCRTNCQCSASPARALPGWRLAVTNSSTSPGCHAAGLAARRRSRNRVRPGQRRSTSRPILGYSKNAVYQNRHRCGSICRCRSHGWAALTASRWLTRSGACRAALNAAWTPQSCAISRTRGRARASISARMSAALLAVS